MLGSLSIVIPVYNSEQSLPVLLARLEPLLPSLAERVEVLLIDDGSSDGTAGVVDREARTRPWVRGIHLMRNYGQHNALLCGIRNARFEITVTMDDDLQNPPEEIPRLLAKIAEGYDAVYGYPQKETHGLWRNLASRITKATLRGGMGVDIAGRVSSFRAFQTALREGFADYRGAFVSVDVLLTWSTTRFTAIPVSNPPRTLGVSNYTPRKLVVHALNMMTGFSVLPLQIASVLGFTFALFGLATLLYVLGRYLIQGGSVPGFPFLASILSIFSGAQLFSLGIIGEYLARMHFRAMDKPSYTVRSTTASQHHAP
jgi:glycosyltransferase involved in cell wall biosynthesis